MSGYHKGIALAIAIVFGGMVVGVLLDHGDPVSFAFNGIVFVWLVKRCVEYIAERKQNRRSEQ